MKLSSFLVPLSLTVTVSVRFGCVWWCYGTRGKEALERRVLEATRHATQAVEGEMSARLESDRWRLRCEQVCGVGGHRS